MQVIALFLFILLGAPSALWAQQGSQGGGYVGIIYGLSVPDANNTQDHILAGINGGAVISGRFSFGGYHFVSNKKDGPNNSDFQYSLTGLEGRYNLTTGAKKVFVGLRVGISKIDTVANSTEVTFSPYHYGLVSGYEMQLFSMLNIGIEGSYMAFSRTDTETSGGTVNFSSFRAISFLGVMSINF